MGWGVVISAVLALAGDRARLMAAAELPWRSVTFSGATHKLTLAFEGDEAVAEGEAFLAALPTHEFTFPGKLLADAAVTWSHRIAARPMLTAQVELLLLEDAKGIAA